MVQTRRINQRIFSEDEREALPDEGNEQAPKRQSKIMTSKRHLHPDCVYYD